jgi:hypothetical protein
MVIILLPGKIQEAYIRGFISRLYQSKGSILTTICLSLHSLIGSILWQVQLRIRESRPLTCRHVQAPPLQPGHQDLPQLKTTTTPIAPLCCLLAT